MGIFAKKSAVESLDKVEAKLAALQGEAAKYAGEKDAAESDLQARLQADALGEMPLSEGEHKKAYENVMAIELKRQRAAAAVEALQGQLPQLRRAAAEEAATAKRADLRRVNGDLQRAAVELQKTLGKAAGLADQMRKLYRQSDQMRDDLVEVSQCGGLDVTLEATDFPMPLDGAFEAFMDRGALDQHNFEFLVDTPERIEQAERERRAKEAARQAETEENARLDRLFEQDYRAGRVRRPPNCMGIMTRKDFPDWQPSGLA